MCECPAVAGRDVRVWERDDGVGGRVRTDAIDGFLCDRGFQVLNPAYPELQRAVDTTALDLQPFAAGVAVRREVQAQQYWCIRYVNPGGCQRCWPPVLFGPQSCWRLRAGLYQLCVPVC